MNELHAIRGLTEKQLEDVLAYARDAQLCVLDAAGVVRDAQASATLDFARKRLAEATGALSGIVNHVNEALAEREWCDGCGDGAPGTVLNRHGATIPCERCAR